MINCSIHNYKEWIDAYINGELSLEDMHSAEAFLNDHPNVLDTYLQELEEFTLIPEKTSMPGKNNLSFNIIPTGNIDLNNFTEYFIGFYEGILNQSQKFELESFIETNPKLLKEFKIYGQTKLIPDTTIEFVDKTSLLKQKRPAIPLFWYGSIAASILVLITLFFLWPSGNNKAISITNPASIEFKTVVASPDETIQQAAKTQTINIHKNVVVYNPIIIREENSLPVAIVNNHQVEINVNDNSTVHQSNDLALKIVPPIEYQSNPNSTDDLAEIKTKKKGLFDKIISGEKTYIEDFVNATFNAFDDNNVDNKWVLKVDRDEDGKSKRVKFSSPIFSVKSNN
jgi:hypothetical protein